jgi:hypothetical protein
VHSRRTLKIHCSAKALAFGVWGGVVRSTLMLAAAKTTSNGSVNLVSRSWTRKRNCWAEENEREGGHEPARAVADVVTVPAAGVCSPHDDPHREDAAGEGHQQPPQDHVCWRVSCLPGDGERQQQNNHPMGGASTSVITRAAVSRAVWRGRTSTGPSSCGSWWPCSMSG